MVGLHRNVRERRFVILGGSRCLEQQKGDVLDGEKEALVGGEGIGDWGRRVLQNWGQWWGSVVVLVENIKHAARFTMHSTES
jgi:hypothetical protein